jgi:TonB-linked SusC/RagA family outer membrane protein
MRKIATLLPALILLCVLAFGQTRTITGTVTDNNGVPVPFASINIKGTTKGTTADDNGVFKLDAAAGQVLVITAIGVKMKEVTVGTDDTYAVQVETVSALDEVVVTALNIRRDKRSVSYSAQTVDGDKLTISRETNIASAIAGKVAGVQVVGTPSLTFGAPNIRIRGINTLDGGDVRGDLNAGRINPVGPLYVLDGTPVDARAINMDNVENISVLKGAAATALYGQRAVGGVILVTSRKGKKNAAPVVEFTSAFSFEKVGLLPDYQNQYAGGYSGDFIQFSYDPSRHPADWAAFDGQNIIEYYADESWGPKMDGREYRPYWSWFPGPDFGKLESLRPREDNVRDFFETGLTFNNNIAVSGGGNNYTYRLTYNNLNRTTPLPNSRQNRNIITASGTFDVTKKITISNNINFQTISQTGNFLQGYGSGITASFNQWFQRQLDIKRLKNYKNADGSFNSWNILGPDDYDPDDPTAFLRPLYWDNPYYDVYENAPNLTSSRVFGDMGVSYDIFTNFKISGNIRADIYNENSNGRVTEGGLNIPAYSEASRKNEEWNYEMLLSYRKKTGDWDIDANLGGNLLRIKRTIYDGSTVGGLAIPGFYSLASSQDRPNAKTSIIKLHRNSLFARASFGWRSMLYLDLSGRNDWSSALPTNNNSYFYPSAGLSFVFSELAAFQNILAISFAKLRASVGQIARDLEPYNIYGYYEAAAPYGSNATLNTPNTQLNPNLKPNLQTSYEGGLEMRFFNSRLGFDAAYYKNINTDQILAIQVAQSSGVGSSFINAGKIETSGWEFVVDGSPFKTKDFEWNIMVNFARSRSKVVELAAGLDNYVLGNATTFRKAIQLQARVGETWGQIVGTRYLRDSATGMPLLTASGNWRVQDNQVLANALPDFTGGVQNYFRFKNLTLGVNIDFQKGGAFYSVTRMFTAYSGLSAETVGNNDKGNPMRDAVADGGGLRPIGIMPDGKENTGLYVDPQVYFGRQFDLHEKWIYDASFIKLREISLGYAFNPKIFGRTGIKGLNISLIARNVALLSSNVDGIDPSELEVYWHEGGQLPATRSLGINARFTF